MERAEEQMGVRKYRQLLKTSGLRNFIKKERTGRGQYLQGNVKSRKIKKKMICLTEKDVTEKLKIKKKEKG